MSKRLPAKREIENAAKELRSREFLYLASFADIINRYMDIRFKKLNRLRYGVLSLLITRGGSLTHTRLAGLLFRSKHSVTQVIDSLEEEGLVIRDPATTDRRVVNVRITSTGINYVIRTFKYGDMITEEAMSCLKNNELKTLKNLIEKLRQAMIDRLKAQ